MSGATRSSLIVNARVHLSASKGRGAVISHNVEYIATRLGADKSLTPDDARRAELAERMELAGYYAKRPGSTALWDQDGALPLAEARKRLEIADGALVTMVVSVRREEAEELRLNSKSDWQKFARKELTPALSKAMDISESSVRWIAAEHENAEASKHIHVIAWSANGSFDSLMNKKNLDVARNMLTDAALEPALKQELAIRDLARYEAIEAVKKVPAEEIYAELPQDGRISFAHLKRWHPDIAEQIKSELKRLEEIHPEIQQTAANYKASIEHCAELKGLKGSKYKSYVHEAMADFENRRANALLKTIAPNRTELTPEAKPLEPVPTEGPSFERKRMQNLEAEVKSCLKPKELEAVKTALDSGKAPSKEILSKCPSYRISVTKAPLAVARAIEHFAIAQNNQDKKPDLSEQAAKIAARNMAGLLMASIRAARFGSIKPIARELSHQLTNTLIGGLGL